MNFSKTLIGLAMSMALLAGCSNDEPKGEFKNVKVLEKRTEEQCGRGCWNDYYIKFEKGGTIVELETDYENVYNLFTEGNVVTVTYNSDYLILDVKFPTMEGDVAK